MNMKITAIVLSSIFVSACTWVELTGQGRQVLVVDETYPVESCKKSGTINTKTRADIVSGSPRDPKKVALELQTLARNEAAKLSANTLVPISPPQNGEQQFKAYSCIR